MIYIYVDMQWQLFVECVFWQKKMPKFCRISKFQTYLFFGWCFGQKTDGNWLRLKNDGCVYSAKISFSDNNNDYTRILCIIARYAESRSYQA